MLRMQHIEQRFRHFGKIVVEAMVDAGGEKCEALEQSLDVRVFTLVRFQLQSRRDFRIARGVLRAEPAEIRQFTLVVEQQIVLQRITRNGGRAVTSRG